MLVYCIHLKGAAQLEYLNEINQLDRFRLNQLLGLDSSSISFTQLSATLLNALNIPYGKGNKKKLFHFAFPGLMIQYRNNNHLGLGGNDGNFLPSVGSERKIQFNFNLRFWKLYLQFSPDYISSENRDPIPFHPDPSDGNYMARYYLYTVNKIDQFDRFGKMPINSNSLGQSAVYFRQGAIGIGISNENIWWGPALRNSLVLSNHADGFPHLVFKTIKPIKTAWGNIETEWISGNLTNPSVEHPDHESMRKIWAGGIATKDSAPRALAGFNLSWEPKWLSGFYLGIAGTATQYQRNKQGMLFSPFTKQDSSIWLGAVYVRYFLPKDKAELYLEFGRSDRRATFINIFQDSIPLGYTVGFRKLFPLTKAKGHIQFLAELTRLQLADPRMILTSGNPYGPPQTNSWYTNAKMQQGYTNNAQILGAWIGPGSNSQFIKLGWVHGPKQINWLFERVSHNNDFYQYNYARPNLGVKNQITNKYWADISTGLQSQWNFHGLIINGGIAFTKLLNYRWTKVDGGFSGPSSSDRNNTQFFLSLAYQVEHLKINTKK